uniref:Uncharacterized protein MANES_11G090000 n=1 Tax=Rhizophora mucronata TaxID=61149 RepID=A0A2P2L8R2_RHIMU
MSHMLVKLLRGTGMKRTNTSSLLQDGRYMTQRRSGNVIPSMGIELLARNGLLESSFGSGIDRCFLAQFFVFIFSIVVLKNLHTRLAYPDCNLSFGGIR